MTQEELIYYEIEKRGGRITSFELMHLGIGQYQARLKGLREKLALKGIILSEAVPIQGQKRNFMYELRTPRLSPAPEPEQFKKQGNLFGDAA